jgi:hypothetical protein
MVQPVIHVMASPLERNAGVLTLGCGHLWSYRGDLSATPKQIDCCHCDRPQSESFHWLEGEERKEMLVLDTAVRALRIGRAKEIAQ